MAENSPIEWTDATWNPVAGCSLASAGCTNCYAMRMAARLDAMGVPKNKGLTRKSGGRAKWTGTVRCDESVLAVPHRWRRPRKVFVNSMSDLFHADVPTEFIRKVWDVMEATPRHDYQLLTKRPDRMREVLLSGGFKVLPNAWLGTSVEGPDVTDRIDQLRGTPAAIRYLSRVTFLRLLVSASAVPTPPDQARARIAPVDAQPPQGAPVVVGASARDCHRSVVEEPGQSVATRLAGRVVASVRIARARKSAAR